jgi:hypothetical protein
MAEKITVSIVDGLGNKLRDLPPVKTPVKSDQLIATLKEDGYGMGDLLDPDGDKVLMGTDMNAGNYTYRVTGESAEIVSVCSTQLEHSVCATPVARTGVNCQHEQPSRDLKRMPPPRPHTTTTPPTHAATTSSTHATTTHQ